MLSSLLIVGKELSTESDLCELSVLIIMSFGFAVVLVCADLGLDLLLTSPFFIFFFAMFSIFFFPFETFSP